MGTMGDRLREVADRLTAEREVQIKATARILGAAAQIAQNHDRLISEVSEMVQGDLAAWDVDRLKREFGTLKAACAHFGKTARRWQDLVAQLGTPTARLLPAAPDLAGEVHQLQTQVRQLQAQVHQLQDQVATVQRAIEQLQGGSAKSAALPKQPRTRKGRGTP
ncbi:MAG TPA: hypothetical protein DCQ32_08195 [Cyanobacteria bacterium UBA8156]|jgi:methyl-accepting chemotaxis protein|nr:hypothetical protein [Cyanobacteria bacterium UBA8156]